LMLLTDEHGYEEGSRLYDAQLTERETQQAALGREFAWSFMHPSGEALATIAALVEQDKIRPVIDRVYQMDDLAAAHEYVESRRACGKVVISIHESEWLENL